MSADDEAARLAASTCLLVRLPAPKRQLVGSYGERNVAVPYLVFRDGFGKPIDASLCTIDCQRRLDEAVKRHQSQGWQVTQLDARRYDAKRPDGAVVQIAIEDMLPDGVPRTPARP